jgi:hypothetical protein
MYDRGGPAYKQRSALISNRSFVLPYLDGELDATALEENLGRHTRVEEHFRHCASLEQRLQSSRQFVRLAQCNTELFRIDEVDNGDCRDVDDEAFTGDGEIERSRVVGKLGKAVEEFRESIRYGDFLYRNGGSVGSHRGKRNATCKCFH